MKSKRNSSFVLEAQLVRTLRKQVVKVLEADWPDDGFEYFSELQVGAVIADLVVVRFPGGRRKPPLRRGDVSVFDGFVVSELLRSRRIGVQELAERLFTRSERIADCLRRMERLGIVIRESDEKCRLDDERFPRNAQVVAIEAKLSRWKDAVDQARSYSTFSNQAYVALPEGVVEDIPRLPSECIRSGVGLISVGRETMFVDTEGRFHSSRAPGWAWIVLRAVMRERS